ncbi:hypothetical protein BLNAU_16025 [Blattamonas nauphoetae]|uniref:Enhancer of polycomb-like protein n=1 Tax=Blattamonas nauphoetae TaxID=2049346 RepID=A0ABQ9XCF5_9EUKA|nr:hypothetical protein BLNAU_16025 [Blattamonas nauphoetae]
MDETEKEEAHLTRALNATESGPGSQFTIPAPKFTLIDRTPRPQANFRLPLFYFPSNERKKEVMISIVEYTCSAEDFLWLDANKNIGPFASIEFTEDNFEYLMDRLEKLSPPPGKLISFQQFSSYIISEAQEDATIAHLADKTVLNPVYQHWSNARRKMGNALLRRLATPTPLTNKDLTYSFRLLSREISRKQLKVNQFWHMERVEHILESIRQIKQILDDVRKREELKLGYIKTVNKIQLYQLFILQRRKEVEISSSEFPQWMFSGQSQQKLYNQSLSTSTPLLTSLSRSGSTITLGKQTDEDSLEEDPKQIDLYIKTRLKTPVPTEESSSEDSLFGTTSEDSHSRRARQKTRKQQRSTRGSSRRRQRQHSLDTQQDTGAASLSGDSEESFSDVNFDVSATAQQAPPIQSLTAHLENFDIIGETMQYLTQVRGTAADMITNWRDLSPFTVDDRHAKENKLYDSESEMIWSSADGESNADDEQSGDGRWELGSSEGKEGEASGELFAMIGQMLSEWGQKGELGPNTAMLKDTEEAQPDRADEAVNHEIVSFLLRCYSEQGRSETDGPTGDQQQTRGEALTRTVKARIQRKRGISATSASASQLTYQPSSTPEHPRLDTTPSNPSTSPHVHLTPTHFIPKNTTANRSSAHTPADTLAIRALPLFDTFPQQRLGRVGRFPQLRRRMCRSVDGSLDAFRCVPAAEAKKLLPPNGKIDEVDGKDGERRGIAHRNADRQTRPRTEHDFRQTNNFVAVGERKEEERAAGRVERSECGAEDKDGLCRHRPSARTSQLNDDRPSSLNSNR